MIPRLNVLDVLDEFPALDRTMTASITANACYAPLFSDPEMARLFQTELTLQRMLEYELTLTKAFGEIGTVPSDIATDAIQKLSGFAPNIDKIGRATAIDGLPVPEFIRQLKAHVGEELAGAIHTGSTSQDLMDTVLVLALKDLSDLLQVRIEGLISTLTILRNTMGNNDLIGRTRMQAALPVTVFDRVTLWLDPLERHLERLTELRPRVELLQLGGPVGTRASFHGKGDEIATRLSQHFGLGNPKKAWHAMRDGIVEYAGWLSLVTGSLGKMGQDVCLMAQQGIDEITLSGGGKSSAMPHKQNPILAETLVTFARFNSVLIGGMHQTSIHEQERSGTAWALEWMCLPQMAETTGKSLELALQMVDQIESIGRG